MLQIARPEWAKGKERKGWPHRWRHEAGVRLQWLAALTWLIGRARWPEVSYYRIAPPRKVSPADNLPAKIRPSRRPSGRDGFLKRFSAGKFSARVGFLGGGRSYSGKTFYGAGDILIREDISISWLSLAGRIFRAGDILMWHRLQHARWHQINASDQLMRKATPLADRPSGAGNKYRSRGSPGPD